MLDDDSGRSWWGQIVKIEKAQTHDGMPRRELHCFEAVERCAYVSRIEEPPETQKQNM